MLIGNYYINSPGNINFLYEIHFDKKDEVFKIKWGKDFDESIIDSPIDSDFNKIKEKAIECAKQYFSQGNFLKKVILVGITSSALPKIEEELTFNVESDGYDEYRGCCLGFIWAVVNEYEISNSNKYLLDYGSKYLRYKPTNFSSKETILNGSFKINILEFNDENLAFVMETEKSMEKMVETVSKIIGDKEQLISFIETKNKLLI